MAEAGYSGCKVDISGTLVNAIADLANISDIHIVQVAIKNYLNYFFLKGLPRGWTAGLYQREKAKHLQVYNTFDDGTTPSVNKDSLINYILSIFSVDILPSVNYKIYTGILNTGATCSNGRAIETRRDGARTEIPGILMRKLGEPFSNFIGNENRYSITTFLNFCKKVDFLNTFAIHNDLHGGNFVFSKDTNEFNIIDMGEIEEPNFDASASQKTNWANRAGQAVRGHWSYGLERLEDGYDKFIHHLYAQNVVGNRYWREIGHAVRPAVAAAGQSIFNDDNWVQNTFYERCWGAGGELRRIYDNTPSHGIFRILTNAVGDMYFACWQISSKSQFWRANVVVRFFAILCSFQNPLLRPFPGNIQKLLSKVLKAPQDSVTLTKKGHVILNIESTIGESTRWALPAKYRDTFAHPCPDSVWQRSAYLKYMRIYNYYLLCHYIQYSPTPGGASAIREIGGSRNGSIFNGLDRYFYKSAADAHCFQVGLPGGGSRWVTGAECQLLEYQAILKLRESIAAVEPLAVIADPGPVVGAALNAAQVALLEPIDAAVFPGPAPDGLP